MADQVRRVATSEWVGAVSAARDEGYDWFDLLTCVDEIGRESAFRIVVRLEREPGDGVRLECLVDRDAPALATLAGVFAGAAWREREVSDFFGVVFAGGDDRPLLGRPDAVGHVLRKDAVLAARTVTPWPGSRDPGETAAGRRRAAAPGVPDPDVWGDREGDPATAAEVAASVAGGRRRR